MNPDHLSVKVLRGISILLRAEEEVDRPSPRFCFLLLPLVVEKHQSGAEYQQVSAGWMFSSVVEHFASGQLFGCQKPPQKTARFLSIWVLSGAYGSCDSTAPPLRPSAPISTFLTLPPAGPEASPTLPHRYHRSRGQ